jgi:hypothetical protein
MILQLLLFNVQAIKINDAATCICTSRDIIDLINFTNDVSSNINAEISLLVKDKLNKTDASQNFAILINTIQYSTYCIERKE